MTRTYSAPPLTARRPATDGGEGGTGAAPLAFSDHVALPFKLAIGCIQAQRCLTDACALGETASEAGRGASRQRRMPCVGRDLAVARTRE